MTGSVQTETVNPAVLKEQLSALEPRSLGGMPPVVWDHAEGYRVWDTDGKSWIDFTSAVVLTNAGHAHPSIGQAIRDQLDRKLWHNYCNPSAIRLRTLQTIREILPPHLDKILLLTTGSEAVECAIKLMRLHGQQISPDKIHILSYTGSFHGRTMAAQRAGGFPDQQAWMGMPPDGFRHIPFPECARCPWGKSVYADCGRECLQRSLAGLHEQGLDDDMFAGVITETFQGPFVAFMPGDYVQALREWASEHTVLLTFDEIQAGFGRTGRWFGFEHYGVEPDLLCMGKGMTSCLPMSGVAGRAAIMDLPHHGEMSSTHTGNPLCCAATIANIHALREDGLVDNAMALEPVAQQALKALRERFPEYVGAVNGHGLAWGVYIIDPTTGELNVDLAQQVTSRCMERGLLMLQTGRGTLKLAPPLCITEDALLEGIDIIATALEQTTCRT